MTIKAKDDQIHPVDSEQGIETQHDRQSSLVDDRGNA